MTVADAMRLRSDIASVTASSLLDVAMATMIADRHNCVLVVDDASPSEVLGIITPRDVLRAWTERISGSVQVGGWLRGVRSSLERTVKADLDLREAATTMASSSLHHLLVLSCAGGSQVVGVISSLDIAHAIGSA